MSIDFACPSCEKKFRVKDELAGKSAKCSKCNSRFKVPMPVRKVPDLEPLDAVGDLGDWFDSELSASDSVTPASKGANVTGSASTGKNCSACGNTLATGAVICVACGFDTRSGKKHVTKKVLEADQPESKVKHAAKQSASLARGALFSAIGAALGAAVWVAVAIGLEVQIGWIAWGLGFAAGAGMAIGHEDDDGTTAGIIAGGISILGILGAKFYLFKHFTSYFASNNEMFETMGEQGVALQQALTQALGENLSFSDMFGPIDGLFILLAVGSAYKIGSGQITD